MPLPELTPELEAAIREGHARGDSYVTISETTGLTAQNIGRLVKKIGLLPWTYGGTAAANEKMRERAIEQRAALADALLADAIAIRERLWDEYELIIPTPAGPQRMKVEIPDAKATADLTAAIERLLKSHDNLMRMGAGQSVRAAQSVMVQMQEALARIAADWDDEEAE